MPVDAFLHVKIVNNYLFCVHIEDISECSFIKFQIWDFPGHIDFCDPMFQSDLIFNASCAVIFVIDAQVSPFYLVFIIMFN